MAYHCPIFTCGCGYVVSLDVREKSIFSGYCKKCKTHYSIELIVPVQLLMDPSRPLSKNYGKTKT